MDKVKNLSGNYVSNVWMQYDKVYKKQPKYLCDNEEYALVTLAYTGMVPNLIERPGDELLVMEYLENEGITSLWEFLDGVDRFYDALCLHGFRHGDLTRPHIFVVNNQIKVIDWAESRLEPDPRPDKRREGDIHWLTYTVGQILVENGFREQKYKIA